MALDFSDLFGNTARARVEELESQLTFAHEDLKKANSHNRQLRVAQLIVARQAELTNGYRWLEHVAARINRHDDRESCFELMLYDLQTYVEEDVSSGALQLNLPARPLLMVMDIGLQQTVLALVRGGESLSIESKGIINLGGAEFEAALAEWLQERFCSSFPVLTGRPKELFTPMAERLFTLMCQGAPQGEIEETVIFDSQSFTATIPLVNDDLKPAFGPLLNRDGRFVEALQTGLKTFNCDTDSIDRIVCLGMFGRFPLLHEILRATFHRTVLVPDRLPTITMSEWYLDGLERIRENKDAQEEKKRQQEEERLSSTHSIKSTVPQDREFHPPELYAEGFLFLKNTAIHSATSLMWPRSGNLARKTMTWMEAMKWVSALTYAGYDDWRLPTREELEALVSLAGNSPYCYLNSHGFEDVEANYYWTAISQPGSNNNAAVVGMTYGGVKHHPKSGTFYAWPVRAKK